MSSTSPNKDGLANKTIREQCEELNIELETIRLQAGGKRGRWTERNLSPEDAGLACFESLGWQGVATEGNLIQQLMHACCFPDGLPAVWICKYPWSTAFMPHACEDFCYPREMLIEAIKVSTRGQLERNWSDLTDGVERISIDSTGWHWPSRGSILSEDHFLTKDKALALFDRLGPSKIADIANIYSQDYYQYRNGWADLTIWKGDLVKFVEVKAGSDRLHDSQFRHIYKIARPLGLAYSVLCIQKLDK
jgi:hypothetical protein